MSATQNASKLNKQLAKITKAKLEIQQRGILNFWIFVEYEDGGSQGIGGITLDDRDKEKNTRVGTAFGCEVIRRLLLALGVDDFAEMEGKAIWVIGKGQGLSFEPKGIQRLEIDGGGDAVIFDEIAAEFGLKSVDKSGR
jgi:hypothetical protein